MSTLPRRRFLLTLGGGSLSALGAAAYWRGRQPSNSVTAPAADELQSFTRSAHALGSKVAVTVVHADEEVAQRAIAAMFAELSLVEDVMSLYRPHSQLCRLNRDGSLEDPHPYLVEVLEAAQSMSRRTDGAFDVTVQPLWSVYSQAAKQNALPNEDELAAARQLVNWERLEIAASQVRLLQARAAVTLNGIAQGFGADRSRAVLRAHGIEHALIDAGELAPCGRRAQGDFWTAGIQHPRDPDAYISLVRLDDRCLATSGDYASSFSDDHRDNHIFDPRTGRSPTELASMSVVAPTAMLADALSTAVFVLGAERGQELIARFDDADMYLVLKDGRTLSTAGFPAES